MEEMTARQHAEAHARAMVAGDLSRAAEDLSAEGSATAGPIMKQLPRPIQSAEVVGVTTQGEEVVAFILYSGAGKHVTVESRWAERDGRPRIVGLKLG
jgi:hypothetical protein